MLNTGIVSNLALFVCIFWCGHDYDVSTASSKTIQDFLNNILIYTVI